MLFKPQHVEPILNGTKTQTRRLWKKPMVKVGGLYWAQTQLFKPESRFARLRVTRLWQERLGDISEADARAEGYENSLKYFIAFREINHVKSVVEWVNMRLSLVYCVEFELLETLGG